MTKPSKPAKSDYVATRRYCHDPYNVAAAHNPAVAPDKSVVVKHTDEVKKPGKAAKDPPH